MKEGRYYSYYNKKGARVKNRWVNVGQNRYFFNEKGRAVTGSMARGGKVYVFRENGRLYRPRTPRVVAVKKNKYYVDVRGRASRGWFTVNNRLYYADSKGRLYLKNRSREGITFTDQGYAADGAAANSKLLAMNILSRITTPGMSDGQKLQRAWSYVTTHMSYCGYYPSWRPGWQKELAAIALGQGRGNCYGYACAFAALAREIGYDPYLICGRVSGTRDGAADGYTRHCWVRINGAYYDPEAHALGWYRGVYGAGAYGISHTVQSIVRYGE
ncbi:MAG: transglutaminase domain-containing protein [Eubacteriales bacterium]|nr:transglutaminase domain-containing protein [Eubacteriales bacterium]